MKHETNSLFPEVDAEIIEIKAQEESVKQKIKEAGELYRPSNATEGEWFENVICGTCKRYGAHNDEFQLSKCRILGKLFFGEVSEVVCYNGSVMCLGHSQFDFRDFKEFIDAK